MSRSILGNYCVHLRISLCVLHTFSLENVFRKLVIMLLFNCFMMSPSPELRFQVKLQSFTYCCCICSKYSIAYSSRMPVLRRMKRSFHSFHQAILYHTNTFRRFSHNFFHTQLYLFALASILFRLCKRG